MYSGKLIPVCNSHKPLAMNFPAFALPVFQPAPMAAFSTKADIPT